MAELTREQQWLKRLVGNWEYESQMEGQPQGGNNDCSMNGRESVRAIGDLWIQGELHSMHKDQEMIAITSLGYDPAQKKIVGTWFCSLFGYMWIYSGTLDESGRTLILDTVGPDMKDPTKTCQYQDITTIDENGQRTMFSQTKGEDGTWHPFMTMKFKRKGT